MLISMGCLQIRTSQGQSRQPPPNPHELTLSLYNALWERYSHGRAGVGCPMQPS